MKKWRIGTLACLLILMLSCQRLAPGQPKEAGIPAAAAQDRVYENEAFTFTIPAGWATYEEVWGRPLQAQDDYYGLGVTTAVTIQHPAEPGKGSAFFSVAISPLAEGESLESRFSLAYENAVPEIENMSQRPLDTGTLSGFEITYRRPWGEPWWKFQDIWVEKDRMVYVLSFHAAPNAFDSYGNTFRIILDSFQFKD